MPVGRRLPLAAASGVAGGACAVAPTLGWLAVGRNGHCGWTCYVPLPTPGHVATLPGRAGAQVALPLAVLLFVVAALCAVLVLFALRGISPPVPLGRALTVASFAALVWTVVVIVRYAEGGTLVRTRQEGMFSPTLDVGAVVALIATAASALIGGGVALRARWATVTTPGPGGSAAPTRANDPVGGGRYPDSPRS